ncbi:alginate biosynthesis protein AlgA [Pseudomonas sp. B1(2018)]|nr:alginate biosynthesis protein AlgA [Pseudomonas sp. B1(2018)]
MRCSRGSYLGEDDIERIEDIYGRSTPVERRVAVKTIAQ